MCHDIRQTAPLAAMKALLRDLENTKLIYPDGLNIVRLRRDLRAKITELEKAQNTTVQDSETHTTAADYKYASRRPSTPSRRASKAASSSENNSESKSLSL